MHRRSCVAPPTARQNRNVSAHMTQTPYAPPSARVADPQSPRLSRPLSVHRAAICLWISAAVAVVSIVLHARIVTTADVVIAGVSAALLALVAAKVNAGRRWARWLFVAVWILGSFSGMAMLVLAPQAFLALPGTVQTVGVLQFALQTGALVLLFTAASRQWFGASDTASADDAR